MGAALILLCVWIVSSSESFQSCIASPPDQSGPQNLEESRAAISIAVDGYRRCTGDFVHENGEAIIAAFTVILAFSTIFLWVATRSLVKGAERTARFQLRAYIGIDQITISNVSAGEKPLVHVRIKNYGQTPAYDVRHFLESIVAEKGNETFVLDRVRPRGAVILDPTNMFGVRSTMDNPLTAADHAAVMDDTKRIFFFGEVHYRDAFKHDRVTYLRYETSGATLTAEKLFSISHQGNSAT
jgi:hypothetical protein